MRKILNPFAITLTMVLLVTYIYISFRLTEYWFEKIILFIPFFFVWIVPVKYWIKEQEGNRKIDFFIHMASYLSMGWLSFLIALLVFRDIIFLFVNLFGLSNINTSLFIHGNKTILGLSLVALVLGIWRAKRGPCLHNVEIPIKDLPKDLDGFCIVQISDLHVGFTIGKDYVEQVVSKTQEINPDLIVLTGDIVDGKVKDLAESVEPLSRLSLEKKAILVLGNHDYYSGAISWVEHFRSLGLQVLLNSHMIIRKYSSKILVAGVVDPAVKLIDPLSKPDPSLALTRGDLMDGEIPALRILLAHNPSIAAEAERAGFDLQLSGHTHAGQFIPWTLVVRLIHQPHYWGLSMQKQMWVYVSAGTGTWGPPIRLGTEPELTIIRLKCS